MKHQPNPVACQPVAGPTYGPWELLGVPLGLGSFADNWEMTNPERLGLLALLRHLRPPVAIEIGTHFGGSLSAIRAFAGKVYSLDIDPTCRERLHVQSPNVDFVTGCSHTTLPPLIAQLDATRAGLGFVLVDGDHTEAGARADVEAVLQFRPTRPLYVLMHDSFNPDVRRGLRAVAWAACAHVHQVELDLVPGTVCETPIGPRELWGGLAVAVLQPVPRSGSLQIGAGSQQLFDTLLPVSSHTPPHILTRVGRAAFRRFARLLRRPGRRSA